MQQKQKQLQYRVQIHNDVKSNQDALQQKDKVKNQFQNMSNEQLNVSKNKKPQKSLHKKSCILSGVCKRQILRIIFIPLLIVLFLLTIALIFKQNNYQTNDYFYSKNIEINRKIRGVVPPLNESKQQVFGEYRIGLIQSFNVNNRRMFQNFQVQIYRNESMKIIQGGKQGKCWVLYKLKFYSSTIFVQKIQSHIVVQTPRNLGQGFKQDLLRGNQSQQNITSSQLLLETENSTQNSQSETQKNSSNNIGVNEAKTNQNNTIVKQKSYCASELWGKLNEILYESHIWTFADDNFYFLQFSQIGDDGNGVLIMKMTQKYPSTI